MLGGMLCVCEGERVLTHNLALSFPQISFLYGSWYSYLQYIEEAYEFLFEQIQ